MMHVVNVLFTILVIVPLYIESESTSSFDAEVKNLSINNTIRTNGQPCDDHFVNLKFQIFFMILVVIFTVGVIGNALAIYVILSTNRLRRQPTNIFIASLAFCDLGALLFLVPIRLNSYMHQKNFCFDLSVCKLLTISDLVFHVNSITHLFVIAIDRSVAVNAPFLHQRIMTRGKTMVCIALSWLYSITWTGLSSFNWEDSTIVVIMINRTPPWRMCLANNKLFFIASFVVVYIVPMFIMAGLYARILRIAIRQVRMIASLSITNSQHEERREKKKRHELKATRTVGIVFGAFVVCWLPLTIIALTSIWCPQCFVEFHKTNRNALEILFIFFNEILPTFNSALNPYLYIILNHNFRQSLKKLLCKVSNNFSICGRRPVKLSITAARSSKTTSSVPAPDKSNTDNDE